MLFSCTKENLNKVLKIFSTIGAKNINLPILRNVLISAEEHGLKLLATNLEIAVRAFIRGKVEETGEFTVPIKLLSDYITLIEADKVDFELKNNELKISSTNSETHMKGQGASDFPVVPEIEKNKTFLVSNQGLLRSINQVNFSVSSNDLRPEISGVLFKFNNGKLTLTGTDSFRLAEKSLTLDENSTEASFIVPLKTVEELSKILSVEEEIGDKNQVEVVLGNNQVLFRYGNFELISRLIEGSYPNYEQIIPKNFITEVVAPREQLLKIVKMSSLFSRSGMFDITLVFERDKIIISSNDANVGTYNSSLSAEVKGNTNKIVLNHRYLQEGLQALDGKNILIKMIDAANPMMIQNYEEEKEGKKDKNDYFYLLMPIRQ